MGSVHILRSVTSLPGADRRLLLRSMFWLARCRAALWLHPFDRVRSDVARWSGHGRSPSMAPMRVGWAVERAARLIPRGSCLTQALAAEVMLRRAGEDPVLRFGVSIGGADFEAHAWLDLGGQVVVGDHGLDRYSVLEHPPARAPGAVVAAQDPPVDSAEP